MDSVNSDKVVKWIESRIRIHEFQLQQFGLH